MKGCGVVPLLVLGGSCGNCGLENMLTRKVNEATWDQASQPTAAGGLAHALQQSLLQRVIVVVTESLPCLWNTSCLVERKSYQHLLIVLSSIS